MPKKCTYVIGYIRSSKWLPKLIQNLDQLAHFHFEGLFKIQISIPEADPAFLSILMFRNHCFDDEI